MKHSFIFYVLPLLNCNVAQTNIASKDLLNNNHHCQLRAIDYSNYIKHGIDDSKSGYTTETIEYGEKTSTNFPWVVAILTPDEGFRCTGVLINRFLVLTTLHCVVKITKSCDFHHFSPYPKDYINTWKVLVGYRSLNASNPNGKFNWHDELEENKHQQLMNVSAVVIPMSDKLVTSDIAILRLDTKVVINEYARPICINGDFQDAQPYRQSCSKYVVAGYGPSNHTLNPFGFEINNMFPVRHRKEIIMNRFVFSFSQFSVSSENSRYDATPYVVPHDIDDQIYCSSESNASCYANGWSGAPVMAFMNNHWFLVGLWHSLPIDIMKPYLPNNFTWPLGLTDVSMSEVKQFLLKAHKMCTKSLDCRDGGSVVNYDGYNLKRDTLKFKSRNPCQEMSACSDSSGSIVCTCRDGFTGRLCSQDVDTCNPNPCKNDGTCYDRFGTYSCECMAGFKGNDCSEKIDKCKDENPCQNQGICFQNVCICNAGFDGDNCTINIDECSSQPCEHGSCHDFVNSYQCWCDDDYEGDHCSLKIDDCKPNPNVCQNGGTCIDGINSYTCNCAPGYTGNRCNQVNEPCRSNPCIHGRCERRIDESGKEIYYVCHCPFPTENFVGYNCEAKCSTSDFTLAPRGCSPTDMNTMLQMYYKGSEITDYWKCQDACILNKHCVSFMYKPDDIYDCLLFCNVIDLSIWDGLDEAGKRMFACYMLKERTSCKSNIGWENGKPKNKLCNVGAEAKVKDLLNHNHHCQLRAIDYSNYIKHVIDDTKSGYTTEAIESGEKTSTNFPWVVAILIPDEGFRCTGVLINRYLVLTTLHCLVKITKSCDFHHYSPYPKDYIKTWKVLVGYKALNDSNQNNKFNGYDELEENQHQQLMNVSAVVIPMSDKLVTSDIAILRLDTKVVSNEYAKPICINGDFQDAQLFRRSCSKYVVAGYGPSNHTLHPFGFEINDMFPVRHRREIIMNRFVFSFSQFHVSSKNSRYDATPYVVPHDIDDQIYCTSESNASCDANGWSGAPVMAFMNNHWFLVGLWHSLPIDIMKPYLPSNFTWPVGFTDVSMTEVRQFLLEADKMCAKSSDCTDGGSKIKYHGSNLIREQLKFKSRNPCKKMSTCSDASGSFVCTCSDGFTGRLCSQDVDTCNPNPCKNGGTCYDHFGTYSCECMAGFKGNDCSEKIDKCKDENPCQNQGICFQNVCICKAGFDGDNCTINIDECSSQPCEHGTCHDFVNSYQCWCDDDYDGDSCSLKINDCKPNPNVCLNGGTCIDGINSYTCNCAPSYTGNRCIRGICIDEEKNCVFQGSDACKSNQIYKGKRKRTRGGLNCVPWTKQTRKPELRDRFVRQIEFDDGFADHNYCRNPEKGYGGPWCFILEKEDPTHYYDYCFEDCVNECKSSPCKNDGICIDGIQDFRCICPSGFTGETCLTEVCHDEFEDCVYEGSAACRKLENYQGVKDTTISGKTCIAWKDVATHYVQIIAELDGTADHNYCRNPNRALQPWCYYNAENYQMEYCFPDCVDNCATAECLNGGSCEDKVDTYRCICQPMYSGQNCQIGPPNPANEPCSSNPCIHGRCEQRVDESGKEIYYVCHCPFPTENFLGENCEAKCTTSDFTLAPRGCSMVDMNTVLQKYYKGSEITDDWACQEACILHKNCVSFLYTPDDRFDCLLFCNVIDISFWNTMSQELRKMYPCYMLIEGSSCKSNIVFENGKPKNKLCNVEAPDEFCRCPECP